MVVSETLKQQHEVSPPIPKGDNVTLVTTLLNATRLFSAQVAETLGKRGCTLDEWMVLNTIQHNNGISMSQIAAATGCSGASLTRTVDKLVTGSLAYREVSQVDRRKVEVFLSDRGRHVHRELSAYLIKLEDSIAHRISQCGLDKDAVVRFLQTVHTPKTVLPT